MSVSLEKKSHAESHAPVEKLEFVSINLSWGARSEVGTEFDLDLSCFLLNGDGKVGAETDFVFYNNPAFRVRLVRFIPATTVSANGMEAIPKP